MITKRYQAERDLLLLKDTLNGQVSSHVTLAANRSGGRGFWSQKDSLYKEASTRAAKIS